MVLAFAIAALFTVCVHAAIPTAMQRGIPSVSPIDAPDGPIYAQDGTRLPPLTTVYRFNQLKDHTNPGLGTFGQRYWMNWQHYSPGMHTMALQRVILGLSDDMLMVFRWSHHSFHPWRAECSKLV